MPPAITDCRLSTAGERAGERGVGGSQRRRWVAELSGPLPPTCHVDSETAAPGPRQVSGRYCKSCGQIGLHADMPARRQPVGVALPLH